MEKTNTNKPNNKTIKMTIQLEIKEKYTSQNWCKLGKSTAAASVTLWVPDAKTIDEKELLKDIYPEFVADTANLVGQTGFFKNPFGEDPKGIKSSDDDYSGEINYSEDTSETILDL